MDLSYFDHLAPWHAVFAEGSANPAGMKATAEWFPAKERGLAGGIYNIGASVGSMLAPPLVMWAILAHSWQAAFVITGYTAPITTTELVGTVTAVSGDNRTVTLSGVVLPTAGGGLSGALLRLVDANGTATYRTIASNTANTITVVDPWGAGTFVLGTTRVYVAEVPGAVIDRVSVLVHVAPGTDAEAMRTLLLRVAAANPEVLPSPAPHARLVGTLPDRTLAFELQVWTAHPERPREALQSALNYAIAAALKQQQAALA